MRPNYVYDYKYAAAAAEQGGCVRQGRQRGAP